MIQRRRSASIRFRLTAWYAGILIAVLVGLGLSFQYVLAFQVRSDVDHQILETAENIKSQIQISSAGIEGPQAWNYNTPSLLLQVVLSDGTVLTETQSIGRQYLPVTTAPAGSPKPVYGT